MPSVIAFPFLRPARDRIRITGWEQPDGAPLPGYLEDWDPSTVVRVRCTAIVDPEGTREDCQLSPADELHMGLCWHCPETSLRGAGQRMALSGVTGSDPVTLSVDIPGESLASRLLLSLVVCLAVPGPGRRSSTAPALAGSLLWSEERELMLEGRGARFPIELVEFPQIPWLPAPGAAWFLDWDAKTPDNVLLNSVRLLINTAHPRIVSALRTDADATEQAALIRSAAFFDIGRTLIRSMLECEEFVEAKEPFARGTVGAHVQALLSVVFPAESMRSLKASMRDRPSVFEARLQDRLRLFAQN